MAAPYRWPRAAHKIATKGARFSRYIVLSVRLQEGSRPLPTNQLCDAADTMKKANRPCVRAVRFLLCSVVAGALHTVVADLGDVQQLRKAELFQLFDFGVQLGDRYDPRGEVQRQLAGGGVRVVFAAR